MTAAIELERAILCAAMWGPDARQNRSALAASVGNFQDEWARAVGLAVVRVLEDDEPGEPAGWGEVALAVHSRLVADGAHGADDFHRLVFSDVPALGYALASSPLLLELHSECVERREQRSDLIRLAEALDAQERRAAHAGKTAPAMVAA